MKRFLRGVPLIAVLCTSFVVQPARAESITVTYVAAAALSSNANTATIGESVGVDIAGATGVIAPLGGFNVTPTGKDIKVSITDLGSATGVPYSVCQENTVDPVAGDTNDCGGDIGANDDVSFPGQCSDGSKTKEYTFPSNNEVTIFIFVPGPAIGCDGFGSVGMATVQR